jgi:hypothetical protein
MRVMLKAILAGLALIGVSYWLIIHDPQADAAPFHFRAR